MALDPSRFTNKTGDEIPPATTDQILGRRADTDPASILAGRNIDPKWKTHYERLLQIRDGIIDQETRLEAQSRENQPEFIKDTAAETGSASFTRDMALGRVSGYQDMLNEVNAALRRIETGTYGICEATGEPIAPERLEAIPWTRFSAEAEAELERKGMQPIRFQLPPQFTSGDPFVDERAIDTSSD